MSQNTVSTFLAHFTITGRSGPHGSQWAFSYLKEQTRKQPIKSYSCNADKKKKTPALHRTFWSRIAVKHSRFHARPLIPRQVSRMMQETDRTQAQLAVKGQRKEREQPSTVKAAVNTHPFLARQLLVAAKRTAVVHGWLVALQFGAHARARSRRHDAFLE